MNYIDLAYVIMIFVMIFAGYQRGFLNSFLSFARFTIGVPLSFYVSSKYYLPIYNNCVSPNALERITEKIQSAADIEAYAAAVKEGVANLPFNLENAVDLSFLDNVSPSSLANGLLENVVEPIAIIIIKFLLFVLTLLLFYVITFIVVKVIKNAAKHAKKPIKNANKFLGAVLGAAKAFAFVFFISSVLAFVLEIGVGENSEFVNQINSSSIFMLVNKYNPMLLLI